MEKRVLVVDDEASVRYSIARLLRNAGYQVTEAKDGEEALALILRSGYEGSPFDLLLTDNRMPQMSGVDLINTLKEKTVSLSFLFISAVVDDELVQDLVGKGCLGVVPKPFQAEELLQKVRAATTWAERPRQAAVQSQGVVTS